MGTDFNDLYNDLNPILRKKIDRQVERLIKRIEIRDQKIIQRIVDKLKRYQPQQIWLFGSFGTSYFKPGISDIDLCIISETLDKDSTLKEFQETIKDVHPIDFFLYTPKEWAINNQDQNSFAQNVKKNGILIFDEKAGSSSRARSLTERNKAE